MLLPHLASAWLQHTDGEPLQIWTLPGHLNIVEQGPMLQELDGFYLHFYTIIILADVKGGGLC